MDSNITWPYHIEDHYCRITWVNNKITSCTIGIWNLNNCFCSFHLTYLNIKKLVLLHSSETELISGSRKYSVDLYKTGLIIYIGSACS